MLAGIIPPFVLSPMRECFNSVELIFDLIKKNGESLKQWGYF